MAAQVDSVCHGPAHPCGATGNDDSQGGRSPSRTRNHPNRCCQSDESNTVCLTNRSFWSLLRLSSSAALFARLAPPQPTMVRIPSVMNNSLMIYQTSPCCVRPGGMLRMSWSAAMLPRIMGTRCSRLLAWRLVSLSPAQVIHPGDGMQSVPRSASYPLQPTPSGLP